MSLAFVDSRISIEELENLRALGLEVVACPLSTSLYDAVSGHPDMLLHVINNRMILVHNEIDSDFVEFLKFKGFDISFSHNKLKAVYPKDVILNGLILKNFFVHNLKSSDPHLLNEVRDKKLIHVKQGYTKCSTAVVSDNAIMTSDIGIAKALSSEKVDVLLLPPGDILLPGLNYGFIGGCCGLINEKTLAFYGNLANYEFENEVLKFLKKYKVEPVYLSDGKLIDRGSIYIVH